MSILETFNFYFYLNFSQKLFRLKDVNDTSDATKMIFTVMFNFFLMFCAFAGASALQEQYRAM